MAACAVAGAPHVARAADGDDANADPGKASGGGQGAVAEDGDDGDDGGQASADGSEDHEGHRKHRRHDEGEGGEGGEEHEYGTVFADLVLGWGKAPFAVQNAAGAGGSGTAPQVPTYSQAPQVSTDVQSFILGANVELFEHFEAGVRVPLTFATFDPDGSASRSTTDVGNIEIEGEYGAPIAKGLRLSAGLGVALPTATSTEIPDDLSNAPANTVDASAFDHYSLAKAAAYARGYEDNALFEANRLGLIPKIGLLYRLHGLSIEPSLKVENLVATSSSLATNYVGELVGALRVGYWIQKEFELAARVWFNAGFAGDDTDKTTSAAVEPQIVLRFGPVRPYAGVILPFAGPPNQNDFIGARVGVAAAF